MYHIGKVVEIFSNRDLEVKSAEATVQATVEMWDDNVITFMVHPKLVRNIKVDDLVLVDYSPSSKNIPVPRNLIVKILRGKKGQEAWEKYRSFHRSRPSQGAIAPPSPAMFR